MCQRHLKWATWKPGRSENLLLCLKIDFYCVFFIIICSKVFGDLFSPTSECYPYNNLPASGIDNRLGPFGRMRRQRLAQELRRCEA